MAIAACIEQKVDFLFIMLQLCNHSHVIAVCVYIWHTLPVSSQMQGYCFLYKDVIGSSVRLSSEPKMNAKWPFFLIKLHSCVRKSATNFLCVKTVSSKVVRHSLACLTVHKWLVGDIPFNVNFVRNVNHSLVWRRCASVLRGKATHVGDYNAV